MCDSSLRISGADKHTEPLRPFPVFHLDYLSCSLTILSTVLVARKKWLGLVVAGINSGLICLIGLRTSQFGFIPANLFCIAVYVVSLRSWLRAQTRRERRCD